MRVPQYIRIDDGEGRQATSDELKPFVRRALVHYREAMSDELGDLLRDVDEGVSISMSDHKFVLINGDYLLAYSEGYEWYARGTVLVEEYLIRVGQGSTSLSAVVDILKMLTLVHQARTFIVGTRAAKNKEAIRRLYRRYGLTETATFMRC